jgi:hypothetical protein
MQIFENKQRFYTAVLKTNNMAKLGYFILISIRVLII